MIRLWIDDNRAIPKGEYNTHCISAEPAILLLQTGAVVEASLDFDLGLGQLNGYDIAEVIKRGALDGSIPRLKAHSHSMSAECQHQVRLVLREAEAIWDALDKADEEICVTSYSEGSAYGQYANDKNTHGFILHCLYHLAGLQVAEKVEFHGEAGQFLNGKPYSSYSYQARNHGYPFFVFKEGAGDQRHREYLARRQDALLRKVRNEFLKQPK